jgi:hypothetical protein
MRWGRTSGCLDGATSVSHNLNYKKGAKNKNLDSQDLAINMANKNKQAKTKKKI